MKLRINVDWIKWLKTKEDQQAFVDTLTSSPVTTRLVEILLEKKQQVETFKEVDYKSHSWAYLCADRNGYTRAINEMLDLLSIKEKD